VGALLHPRRVERELDEELEGFLAASEIEKLKRGMTQDAARRAAKVEMGSVGVVKHRVWGSRWESAVDGLLQDLRLGMRVLRKSPGFAVVAVSSLALGIGANTAIFTVAKRVLLDRLPVRHPEELRLLTWRSGHERLVPPVWGDVWSTADGGLGSDAFSYPVIEALGRKSEAFADLVAFKDVSVTATVGNLPQVVDAELVSGNTFAAMGVQALAGRPLTQADDTAGARVAVVGEGFWRERMGAAPMGTTIHLNGVPVVVVGVAPARFSGLTMGQRMAVFVPIAMQPVVVPRAQLSTVSLLNNPQSWWVSALVRLRPEVTEARAQAELDAVLRQAAGPALKKTPETNAFRLELTPGARGADALSGDLTEVSYVLMGLSGLVLLLACVNLANLLLARASARQREMATRLALGAGRWRIARQSLTESLLLAGMGGAAGLLLGFVARNAIPRMLAEPGMDKQPLEVMFDWQVVAFTAAVALVTGILFGLAPAWQAIRVQGNAALKEGPRATTGRQGVWLGKALVVAQVALSVLLLVGAGLFVRTLQNLGSQALGFRADHLLLFRLNPPRSRYNDAGIRALFGRLEERLAELPGVQSMTLSNIALVGDGHSGSLFHVVGRPPDAEPVRVQTNGVGTDYLKTMGIPLLRGRGFGPQDTATSERVAVINETLGRQFFPKGDALGSSFEVDPEDEPGPVTIVGIAADTRYADMRTETPPLFYAPYQQQLGAGRMVVELRTQAEPGSVLAEARAAVAAIDPDLPLIEVRTMEEQIRGTMAQARTFARLTSGFGLLALMLAAIGVYGILSYAVALRTGEIGIRLALGAQTQAVRWMVLRESLGLLGVGLLAGVPIAMGLARMVQAQLFGLKAFDPWTFVGAAGVVGLMTVLAAWLPARRAAKVDPMVALRCE
jgi:predicted permease